MRNNQKYFEIYTLAQKLAEIWFSGMHYQAPKRIREPQDIADEIMDQVEQKGLNNSIFLEENRGALHSIVFKSLVHKNPSSTV